MSATVITSTNDLQYHFNNKYLNPNSTLTLGRLAAASLTREITPLRANPIPSIDKIENRFIHEQTRPSWPPLKK